MEKINKNHFNNPVVIILLVVLLGFVGYSIFSKNQSNPKKNDIYYFPQGSFSAYFPKQPTYTELTQQLISNQDSVLRDMYYYEADSDTNFSISYTNSAFKNPDTPEKNLKNMITYLNGIGGDWFLVSSEASTYNDLPAANIVSCSKTTQQCDSAKYILKANDLYIIDYVYKSGAEDKTLEKIFLDSLVFGEQPSGSIVVNPTFDSNIDLGSDQPNTNNQDPKQAEIDALKKKVKTLQNTKPQTIIKEVPAPTPPPAPTALSLADIIKQWRLRTVYIECTWRYTDGQIYLQASGSGLAMQYADGQISFITNKHVLSDGQNYGPTQCLSKLPDDDTIYTTTFENDKVAIDGSDWGLININNPDSHLKELVNTDFNYCTKEASVGDSVVILGYPSYGTSYYNITATEGIISGYDGQYYTTSAKIEHGNSGGLAIDEKNNCYLGIPTAVVTGGFESLGRILDVKNIFK